MGGSVNFSIPEAAVSTPSFINAMDTFLSHLHIVKNASVHTVRNYGMDLKAFKLFLDKSQEEVAGDKK